MTKSKYQHIDVKTCYSEERKVDWLKMTLQSDIELAQHYINVESMDSVIRKYYVKRLIKLNDELQDLKNKYPEYFI